MDPAGGLADHLHLAQDGLVLPVLQTQPEATGGDIVPSNRLDTLNFVVCGGMAEYRMRRRRCRASAHNGGDVAGVLEGLAQLQVEVAVGDRGETQAGLGGIVQVGAHGGKVDERHLERLLRAIGPSGAVVRGRRKVRRVDVGRMALEFKIRRVTRMVRGVLRIKATARWQQYRN